MIWKTDTEAQMQKEVRIENMDFGIEPSEDAWKVFEDEAVYK